MRQPRPAAAIRRQRARRRGRLAEWLCRWHLRLRGWRIVARDWRCPSGEIDILARRGGVLAVIEVKSRGDFATGAAALRRASGGASRRAAEAFLLMRPDLAGSTCDSTSCWSRRCACRAIGAAPGAATTEATSAALGRLCSYCESPSAGDLDAVWVCRDECEPLGNCP